MWDMWMSMEEVDHHPCLLHPPSHQHFLAYWTPETKLKWFVFKKVYRHTEHLKRESQFRYGFGVIK